MKALLDKMRADYRIVAEDRKAAGEWSEQDIADIGAAIKSATEGGDRDTIVCWARWMADLSASTVAFKSVFACVGGRIRNAVADHKQTAGKTK